MDGGAHIPPDTAPARPTPLHDPDPYSTPPYGEPGPWAPAPPFQGPGVTPAHGTPYVPSQAPYPTADAVPPQAPYPTVDALPDPAHEIHAYQAHAAPPHATQPHPGQTQATQPHPGQTHASQPHPGQTHASQPHPGQTHASQPHPGQPHPDQTHATQINATQPHPAPADPWQRYDPWAVPNLQQADPVLPVERPSRRKVLVGWGLVVVLVAGGLGGFAGAWVERAGIGDVHLPQAAKVPAGRAPGSVAGIAARALPSVVTLHVSGDDEAGTGTGFVLDTRGHILTNNHVVAPASSGGEITVTFSTGDTAQARVVGRDSGYDLAVVQVSGVRGLTPLALGDSDDVRVGDPVVAIGAPFDLANTVTSGIISAKERPITAGGEKGDGSDISYVDALQTDAPINPGNSGGPLLDAHAQVIGINSAIRSAGNDTGSGESQSGSIGLGFAIPANQARRVAEELINEGHATHPVIGVTLDMGYTGDAARVSAKGGTGGPAVQPGGPGDRAGLKAGDLVTAVDGHRVHSGEELIVKIRAHRPGDRLRLTVERAGAERVVSLVLGASERN
ncbi:trypsin-like peptidase domain-containing protein [Streptomyces sp. NPDC047024]|uniref:S1C family serine protease n=1 Tax=Streptomyces sp. NPDC047024 TaxID=3155476 RepID=UPI0033C899E4